MRTPCTTVVLHSRTAVSAMLATAGDQRVDERAAASPGESVSSAPTALPGSPQCAALVAGAAAHRRTWVPFHTRHARPAFHSSEPAEPRSPRPRHARAAGRFRQAAEAAASTRGADCGRSTSCVAATSGVSSPGAAPRVHRSRRHAAARSDKEHSRRRPRPPLRPNAVAGGEGQHGHVRVHVLHTVLVRGRFRHCRGSALLLQKLVRSEHSVAQKIACSELRVSRRCVCRQVLQLNCAARTGCRRGARRDPWPLPLHLHARPLYGEKRLYNGVSSGAICTEDHSRWPKQFHRLGLHDDLPGCSVQAVGKQCVPRRLVEAALRCWQTHQKPRANEPSTCDAAGGCAWSTADSDYFYLGALAALLLGLGTPQLVVALTCARSPEPDLLQSLSLLARALAV